MSTAQDLPEAALGTSARQGPIESAGVPIKVSQSLQSLQEVEHAVLAAEKILDQHPGVWCLLIYITRLLTRLLSDLGLLLTSLSPDRSADALTGTGMEEAQSPLKLLQRQLDREVGRTLFKHNAEPEGSR